MNRRTKRTLLATLGVAAGLLVAAGSVSADDAVSKPTKPALAGTVTHREGRAVRFQEAGKKARLKKGSEVFVGDHVKTIGKSRIEITLSDGSLLRLGPKTELVIGESRVSTQGEGERRVSVKLMLGKVWSKVTTTFGGDSKYEVTTGNAVAGVRGTTFRVNAEADASTLVRVYSGTVAVAGNTPIYQTHKPGEKRKEVPGPKQITKGDWERVVGSMMSIKIGSNGLPSEPEKFAVADEMKGEEGKWIAWNLERDGEKVPQ